jgi:hypothetical protein
MDEASARPIEDCASWGVPVTALRALRSIGVGTLHPWQLAALGAEGGALMSGRNFVYSAPTGCGKALLADLRCLAVRASMPLRPPRLLLPPADIVHSHTS